MPFEQQDVKPQKGELNRRDFLSTLTTAAGLLALGLGPGESIAESQYSGKREASKCVEALSCESGEGLYQIHQLSEQAILQTYTALLEDACRYAVRSWKNSSFDSTAGYWGDGVSAGNGGIRTTASMLLASGVSTFSQAAAA